MEGVLSWFDLTTRLPGEIRDFVADAYLNATQGTFARSTTYLQNAWATNSIAFTSTASCETLKTDQAGMVADAKQWNLSHQIVNTSSTLQPPLKRIVFLRGGTDWQMKLTFAWGANTYSDIQLSFRDNGTSSGDFTGSPQGSIPVIKFSGNFTGDVTLTVTLKQFGTFPMMLVLKDNGTLQYSVFEMEFVVVP